MTKSGSGALGQLASFSSDGSELVFLVRVRNRVRVRVRVRVGVRVRVRVRVRVDAALTRSRGWAGWGRRCAAGTESSRTWTSRS